MDEPTNHLDIASMEILESALSDYQGTMIVVSHDRYFLDRIVDKLIVIGTDELGNRCLGKTEMVNIKPVYSYYSSVISERREARMQEQKSLAAGSKKRRSAGSEEKARNKTPEELKRFNKYSVEKIEEMITELEAELVEMRERFGDENIYKNPEQFNELKNEYDSKTAELDLLYQAYEHRAK
jgi:ATP-binding cassette subfamily F protein 3